MLHKTNGIALRAVKYGDTSLIVTLFTSMFGVQAYMVQGVRSSRANNNKASYFQPGTLLDLIVYMQPNKSMQRIREFNAAYIFTNIQDDIAKNSIVLFSAELMLRLLPENAPLPELYDFASKYLILLDSVPAKFAANMPLFFLTQCSRLLGYEPKGGYSIETPYLDMKEGGFSDHPPTSAPFTTDEDAKALHVILIADNYEGAQQIGMSSDMRLRLIDWYIAFLQQHTQHLGNIRSLPILRAILH